MRRRFLVPWTVAFLCVCTLVACHDEETKPSVWDTSNQLDDVINSDTETDSAETDSAEPDTIDPHRVDSDGDGIPDIIEIAAGSDPYNSDSDDDGVCDGNPPIALTTCQFSEDWNNDGEVNSGELDPMNRDSDGDGHPDIDDPRLLICYPAHRNSAAAGDAVAAESVISLPEGFSVTWSGNANTPAIGFSSTAGTVFGYLIAQDASGPVGLEHLNNMVAIGTLNKRTNFINVPFTTWWEKTYDPEKTEFDRNAMSSKGAFEYGDGSPNVTPTNKDPAVLRDEIITTIVQSIDSTLPAVSSGESATPCARVFNYHLSEIRHTRDDSPKLISFGAVICEDDFTPEIELFFEDILSGTLHARGVPGAIYLPGRFRCEPQLADADAIVRNNYLLEGYPITSSIRVATRGAGEVPRIDIGQGHWEYDPENNAIVLFDVDILAVEGLVITYWFWRYDTT